MHAHPIVPAARRAQRGPLRAADLCVMRVRDERHAQLLELALHHVLEFFELGPRLAAALPDKVDERVVGRVVVAILQHLRVDLREEADGPQLDDEADEAEAEQAARRRRLRAVEPLVDELRAAAARCAHT